MYGVEFAKAAILGETRSCKAAEVGRRMAETYFSDPIIEGEKCLQNGGHPSSEFARSLANAFQYPNEKILKHFLPETQDTLLACATRFKRRYEDLLAPVAKAA